MKKMYLFITIGTILILSFLILKTNNNSNINEYINVYSWGEFISNGTDGNLDVNKEFTKRTGIKVNYKTFQNNEELFAKLSSDGSDYDVIIPSDYMISKLINNNMLEKLDFKNIPNYDLIRDDFKNLNFDDKNEYSVPYVWGMVGIFYNKKEVKEKNIDWDILWNKKYKNKILMFDNARDSFAISLLRLGYDINTTDINKWQEATKELLIQKPLVQAYVMDQIFNKIENEEAFLAPYYSGDASNIIKNSTQIGFCIPKSGSTRFVDSMCIPKGSVHKMNAEKYINFMCETDISLANALHTGYSTPQKETYLKLDENIRNNKIFYPEEETLNKSQTFINLPDDVNKSMDKFWIEIKSGGISNNPIILIIILFFLLLIYFALWIYKKNKR